MVPCLQAVSDFADGLILKFWTLGEISSTFLNMSCLDLAVSRAVFTAGVFERVLHEAGPWVMEIGNVDVPATREVRADEVVLRTSFPEVCWLDPIPEVVVLRCGERVVMVREFSHPGDVPFEMRFSWRLRSTSQIAA
jgi:hypothetical protein